MNKVKLEEILKHTEKIEDWGIQDRPLLVVINELIKALLEEK